MGGAIQRANVEARKHLPFREILRAEISSGTCLSWNILTCMPSMFENALSSIQFHLKILKSTGRKDLWVAILSSEDGNLKAAVFIYTAVLSRLNIKECRTMLDTHVDTPGARERGVARWPRGL